MMENSCYYLSPFGYLEIKAEEGMLVSLCFYKKDVPSYFISSCPILQETCAQLDEYFFRKRQSFELPIKIKGTVFQKKVWKELRRISYGQTVSYAHIAQVICCSSGYRAVGNANGQNPLAIIVPCHRVVNIDGKLGGYAHGHLIKMQLLNLEREGLLNS